MKKNGTLKINDEKNSGKLQTFSCLEGRDNTDNKLPAVFPNSNKVHCN